VSVGVSVGDLPIRIAQGDDLADADGSERSSSYVCPTPIARSFDRLLRIFSKAIANGRREFREQRGTMQPHLGGVIDAKQRRPTLRQCSPRLPTSAREVPRDMVQTGPSAQRVQFESKRVLNLFSGISQIQRASIAASPVTVEHFRSDPPLFVMTIPRRQ
jgi:hypothetical protein